MPGSSGPMSQAPASPAVQVLEVLQTLLWMQGPVWGLPVLQRWQWDPDPLAWAVPAYTLCRQSLLSFRDEPRRKGKT